MQYLTSENLIKIPLKNNTTTNMALDEYARWLCLIEGVELVSKKATDIGININTSMEWIKPLAFQKYIEERFESMKDEIEHFEKQPTPLNKNKVCDTLQEPVLQ